jgi:hypothetical protein
MHSMTRRTLLACLVGLAAAACGDDGTTPPEPLNPDTAPRAMVDRFGDQFAMLFKRSEIPGLPAAGAPIDLDQDPFVTQGLGPAGQVVRYYNFDVMTTTPAPIWVLYREGSDTPVQGQLNVIDQIPGDPGYNDFWLVNKVTVPADYVANTVTSLQGILAAGYPVEHTDVIVNCPVVPEGSVGQDGPAANGLTRGWYRDQVVFYFNFDEAPIMSSAGLVPVSEIYVAFNVNPDQEGGGPPTGFKTEEGTAQTHNVVETIPGDEEYSPLWAVLPYDNAVFDEVHDIDSAEEATSFGLAALVNCPVSFVGAAPGAPGAR